MNLGFLKIFGLFVVVLVVGVFAFLILADVPVQQEEMVVPITEAPAASISAPASTPAPAASATAPAQ